ncbi:MAG: hypothetical protein VKP62_01860 [Candidatus Sericytochromatia bacterium]|nr:hypothetical protein [Candidatus Sericytochromatia bacterium]
MLTSMSTIAALARLGALVGCLLGLNACHLLGQIGQMAEAEANFRNDLMRTNLRTVALALSMYARDHRGLYPADEGWLQELSSSYYLPNQRLPANPWSIMGEHTQANALGRATLPEIGVGEFQLPLPGQALGKGARPASQLYEPTTFGAILYDASPDRRRCVIYAVGQQGEQAVLVDAFLRGAR